MVRSILVLISGAATFFPAQDRTTATSAPKVLAEQLLQAAESEARNLPVIDRAYAYWLISQAFAKISLKQEQEVLKKSCDAALAPASGEGDDLLRQKTQLDCLRRMMIVQPQVAQQLLPTAQVDVRQQILAAEAAKFAQKGDIDAALTMLSSEASRGAQYPYGRALEVIRAIPADDRPSKDRVFAQALMLYKQKHSRFDVGVEDLGTLVIRLWRDVSPGLVLQAADELLDVAELEATADSHLEITVKSGSDGATFDSLYQY